MALDLNDFRVVFVDTKDFYIIFYKRFGTIEKILYYYRVILFRRFHSRTTQRASTGSYKTGNTNYEGNGYQSFDRSKKAGIFYKISRPYDKIGDQVARESNPG